jgi:hypothetical protein
VARRHAGPRKTLWRVCHPRICHPEDCASGPRDPTTASVITAVHGSFLAVSAARQHGCPIQVEATARPIRQPRSARLLRAGYEPSRGAEILTLNIERSGDGRGRTSPINCLGFGGASRDRTDDLIVANDALSQLSYSPTSGNGWWMETNSFYQSGEIGTNPFPF